MKISATYLVMGLVMANVGCGGGLVTDIVVPWEPLDNVYWSLSMNYRAVNLSLSGPSKTMQMMAVPRNTRGDTLEHSDRPVFIVLDTARLSVDSTGVITARSAGSNIRVVAILQIGTVTHVDTALVKVTATAPARPLTTFSIQPSASDSTNWSWGGNGKPIQPVALDAMNGTINNLQVAYTSSNTRVATVSASGITNGTLLGKTTGKVWVMATTYAYGVPMVDSVEYTIGLPVAQIVDVVRTIAPDGTSQVTFTPSTVTIAVGGNIHWKIYGNGWTQQTGSPAIVFEQPEFVKAYGDLYFPPCLDTGPGNVDANRFDQEFCPDGGWIYRTFDTPGTYVYRDGAGQTVARVLVGNGTS